MLLAVLIMGAMGLVGYVAAKGLGLDGKYLRAFLMVVMFSNGGNYGGLWLSLPLAQKP